MIGIYKFTNKINGKIYIGQSIDIEHRRKEHLRYKDESYFHRSLMKYGNDNFDFEILEECDIMQLDEKERYWISYYHSNNRDKGYNCTDGGEGGQKKAVQQFDLQNNFIQEFASIALAVQTTKVPASNISRCCHKKSHSADGYKWKFKDDPVLDYQYNVRSEIFNKGGAPTKQYIINKWRQKNLNGTKAECIRDTGISRPTVSKWWNIEEAQEVGDV